MSELKLVTREDLELSSEAVNGQILAMMQGLADMMRVTNERMTQLERQVRQLEKLTPAQAAEMNAAIRARAAEICREYRIPGCEKQVATAIRRDVRLFTGARSARDVARCDWQPVREMIVTWDDYSTVRKIREAGK